MQSLRHSKAPKQEGSASIHFTASSRKNGWQTHSQESSVRDQVASRAVKNISYLKKEEEENLPVHTSITVMKRQRHASKTMMIFHRTDFLRVEELTLLNCDFGEDF